MTEEQVKEGQEALQELFSGAGNPPEDPGEGFILPLPGDASISLKPLKSGGWKTWVKDKNGTDLIRAYWGSTAKISLKCAADTLATINHACSQL